MYINLYLILSYNKINIIEKISDYKIKNNNEINNYFNYFNISKNM